MINLKGLHVKHSVASLGSGTVIDQDGDYFVVRFPQKDMKFNYPDAFLNGFLTTDDSSVMADIQTRQAEAERLAKIKKEEELAERLAREEALKKRNATSAPPKKTRKTEPKPKNLAFKCNYNDGGKNASRLGYAGVCSDEIIRYNIEKVHRDWCSQPECPCRQYLDGLITREQLEVSMAVPPGNNTVCYESDMLKSWTALAGTNNNPGPRQGDRRTIKGLAPNKLCFLTTRLPDSDREEDRIVFAAYIIGAADEGDVNNAGFVRGLDGFTIELNETEARQVKLWDHYQNKNDPGNPKWGSGLYRFLTDEQALSILDAMYKVKGSAAGKAQIQKMRDHFVRSNAL